MSDESTRNPIGPKDDLDAVRIISEVLKNFNDLDRGRILRWTKEKLGMVNPSIPDEVFAGNTDSPSPNNTEEPVRGDGKKPDPKTIKHFLDEKKPKSEKHLAAVVAYYNLLIAVGDERKDTIVIADLIDACRKAECTRPKNPTQVLIDAYSQGYLDRVESGKYKLNSVGENLVAMVLPEKPSITSGRKRQPPNNKKK